MTRTRRLFTLAALAALGLAMAQGMMRTPDTPDDPRRGYGQPGQGYGAYGHHGMMQPGGWGYGDGGVMRPGYGGGYGMRGYGPMGGMGRMGSMMGSGTMGAGTMRVLPPDARPLADEVLRGRLEAAARAFGPDVTVRDVMPFTDHTYAQFVGPDGTGLAEVLVDRFTGVVTPEPGPNMMWNARSGMGGYGTSGYGMGRGVGYGTPSWGARPGAAEARYDQAEARERAVAFLTSYLPGAELHAGRTFPGYVTFDYGRDGSVEGMLSVHLAATRSGRTPGTAPTAAAREAKRSRGLTTRANHVPTGRRRTPAAAPGQGPPHTPRTAAPARPTEPSARP